MFRRILICGLLLASVAMTSRRPASVNANAIAANLSEVTPAGPEACEAGKIYLAPASLAEPDGRLIEPLRKAAREANPSKDLRLATEAYARGETALGQAYADLAVTGRKAWKKFQTLEREGRLDSRSPAVRRARAVADALSAAVGREDLGWIAVSGEDDGPYRPVNVPSSPDQQFDLMVPVAGRQVHTRYIVAEGLKEPFSVLAARGAKKGRAPASALPDARGASSPRIPTLSPNARVLVYLHGMDSRLEEAADLVRALRSISQKTGENWTLVSMDLPSSGYADKVDPETIAPVTLIGHPRAFPPGFNALGTQRVPVLAFDEEFVVSFINTLNHQIPIRDRIEAVIGGSLGGNLAFRLGRRKDLPWLRHVVSWSPASVWHGLADGNDIFKQIGVATAWRRAGGDPDRLEESPDQRQDFFGQAFTGDIQLGPLHILRPQPEYWWRRDWACFQSSLSEAKLERQETYTRNFRLWHWRLAAEQLIYSHRGAPDEANPPFKLNRIPMLLMAGEEDDFNFTGLFSATRETAEEMVDTPGRAVFFRATGHSIHNERPNALASEIVRFLRRPASN
ncbi:MAG TPA: hypothetical protein VL588_06170 [Bdellovibrionota bacterium]|nr:hypothetical protein [Bdellovibrionota bacterium]